LESSTAGYDTPWLVYWVIYAFFGFIEYIGNNFFQTLLFYWLGKSVFLLWLMAPGSANGSNMLYKQLIRPLVLKYSPPVSKPVPESGSYATEYHSYASNN
jgi:receptor expression-enhancing protein 5/6